MFLHNFLYSLKTLFRNKSLIFWTFAFPIIMGTFFNLAFSNITSSEKLDIIDIAIVNDQEFNSNLIMKNAFSSLGDSNSSEQLFNITYTDLDNAKKLLDSDKIVGYLQIIDSNPKITFVTSGIDQTIFKYVVEEIITTGDMVTNIYSVEMENNPDIININYQQLYMNVLEKVNSDYDGVVDISNNKIDYVMIEFYTLIAMTCLYGGIMGMVSINQNLANMSNKGKRISISPTKKAITIFSSLFAGYIVQLIGLLLLFLYTVFVLNVDYGDNIILVILLAVIGSLTGLSMGVSIGTLIKASENTKTGLLIGITMFGCFLSGMMGITMKYIVDKNIPILNMINPASIITDGFYSLYYYDTLSRYWFNIISLLVISFILILLSIIGLRRQKYDSI